MQEKHPPEMYYRPFPWAGPELGADDATGHKGHKGVVKELSGKLVNNFDDGEQYGLGAEFCFAYHLVQLAQAEYGASCSISPPMGVNPISSGSPHVRPMGVHRTCGEPDGIKKNTHAKYIPARLCEQVRRGFPGRHRETLPQAPPLPMPHYSVLPQIAM